LFLPNTDADTYRNNRPHQHPYPNQNADSNSHQNPHANPDADSDSTPSHPDHPSRFNPALGAGFESGWDHL
jgi:hypothetical protein